MIVDIEFYKDSYRGRETDEFDRLNAASQSLIESLTSHDECSLLGLNESVLERVRKAICAEIEFLCSLGGMNAVNAKQDVQKTSESYGGSYSYSVDNKQLSGVQYVNGIPYAPLIDIYLSATGLLYTGVDYV